MEHLVGQELVFENEQGDVFTFPILHAFTAHEKSFIFVEGEDDDGEEIVIPFRIEFDEEGALMPFDIEDDEWDLIEKEWENVEDTEDEEE